MKDYAKLVKNSPERTPSVEAKPKASNLVRSAKALQAEAPKKSGNTLGLLLILFIVLVVGYGVVRQYLAHHNLLGIKNTDKSGVAKAVAANSSPQFDFYTVLPKGNVADTSVNNTNTAATDTTTNADMNNDGQNSNSVSGLANTSSVDADAAANNTAPQSSAAPIASINTAPASAAASVPTVSTPSATTATGAKYYLNVGDYATAADAEQMLSQLLLLGVQASVNPKQDSGATAYEVMVGPFNDAAAMNVVKGQLAAHEINALVLQSN